MTGLLPDMWDPSEARLISALRKPRLIVGGILRRWLPGATYEAVHAFYQGLAGSGK